MTNLVMVQCQSCGEWTELDGDEILNRYSSLVERGSNSKCSHCGSGKLDPQSTISVNTFDESRAKIKTQQVIKLNKRK